MTVFTAWTGCVQATIVELIARHADGGIIPCANMLPLTREIDFRSAGCA